MQILEGEPLKNHTSYKLGGPAKRLIIVESEEELAGLGENVLREATIIGSGTNLLVGDKGVNRDVIKINFRGYSIDGPIITALAGTNFSQLAIDLARQGHRDLIFAIGIPGTVGGAVVMNAGTDKFISNVLAGVEVMTRSGEKINLLPDELQYGYRNSILQEKDWIVIKALLRSEHGEPIPEEEIQAKLNSRKKNQPLMFPSAGCWFKGGWGESQTVKDVGMDGAWEGGAVSSPLYPAFILNVDGTAQDVYRLVRKIQEKAKAIGRNLIPEIKIIGDFDE